MRIWDERFSAMAEAQLETRSAALHPRDPGLAELWGIGMGTAAGVSVTPDSARQCPEVDACVTIIEDTLGTVPLNLHERVDEDTQIKRTDHPLHRLLHDEPNGEQSSAEFRKIMEGWRSTYGNAYARVYWRGDGIPSALVPMHPDNCRGFRLGNGKVAYRYRPPGGGPVETLMPSEVLHLRDTPFQRDGITGESVVTRHKETIGQAMAIAEYTSRFFSGNAVPKAFLKPTQPLSAEAMAAAREQFERKHGGLENAHRVGVLPSAMELIKLGIDNDSAQMVEAYGACVQKIARIWGIPLHMIGDNTKSTSWGTGIEQMSIGFLVYFMRPKFVLWEQALNRTLMSSAMRQRFYFEFNVDGLLRGDFKTRIEGLVQMIQWGLASVNEVRRTLNMAPTEGGDERIQPTNYAPALKIMEVLMRGAGQKEPPNGA